MADFTLEILPAQPLNVALQAPASFGVTLQVAQGPAGPPGGGAGGLGAYSHSQPGAAVLWTVTHNLGFKPSVKVTTLGSVEVDALVEHPSDSVALVHLDIPLAGFAFCS